MLCAIKLEHLKLIIICTKKIIDDLDVLSEHLKGYGNSISITKRNKEDLASWKDEYLPIPIHPQYKAFLMDNWEELYNDILNAVMTKLEKEKIHMEFELETINKYI